MVIVSTTGYILTVLGPYLSDFHNNDASILKTIMLTNVDDILRWVGENGIVVVDRGFRDSVGVLEALGLNVAMPSFLNGRRQFDTLEANETRFITKIRWVVESVNDRLKHSKYFNQTIQNSTIPTLQEYLHIVCALINRFRPPMIIPSLANDEVAHLMKPLLNDENFLKQRLDENRYSWTGVDASKMMSFPKLTIEQIRSITLG
ncbi:unnamed protein product [Didymodactylos carnosus]|uniref:DDE Tnp4 domain-containing protein n=1 Tax=Didymodactylos carnosus TaxID=1234261 RepID=A0A814YGZ7_9BILA|nr:unnamed protein product [Didymodactylos carnosus]CAF3991798.1 unnamed protein product [Didymodactylos carnosus]